MTLRGRRIALLINDMRLGGAERQCLYLAEYLLKREASPVIVVFGEDGDLDDRARGIGVECVRERLLYPWSLVYCPFYLNRVRKCLRRLRPDVVMGYTSIPNMYGALTAKQAGASRFVWNQRDSGLARPHPFWEQKAVNRADAFIANSPSGSGFLTKDLGVSRERVSVIRNGVVPGMKSSPSSMIRQEAGIADNEFLLAMVGNLRPPKDPETLLQAWVLMRDHYAERSKNCPHLLLVGRVDPEAGPVAEAVRKYGLQDWVHCTGFRDDIPDVLKACDAGVFSSTSEGLPNAVLEMMAQGLAVVATDIPGVRACGEGGGALRLSPAGDAQAMADSIMHLYENPAVGAEEGATNARFIEDQYSLTRMGDATADVLWPGSGEG